MPERSQKYWITAILLAYLSFSYVPNFGWWISMAGCGLIIFLGYFAWPADYKIRLGIPGKTRNYLFSIILLFVFIFGSYFLINHIRLQNGLGLGIGHPKNFVHIFFYTLNEELILGGLVLFSLKNKYDQLNPIYISIAVALVFSIMHYVLYRWIFQAPAQGLLHLLTLIALFLSGIVRNNLILKIGHIGYSWDLHFSWMAIMFGLGFYHPETDIFLSQTERFNLFFGHDLTLFVVAMLAAITSLWLWLNLSKIKRQTIY